MFDLPHFRARYPQKWGLYPEIQTQSRPLYSAPTPKFHHPMFHCSEIIVFTNIQRDLVENIHVSFSSTPASVHYDGGEGSDKTGQAAAYQPSVTCQEKQSFASLLMDIPTHQLHLYHLQWQESNCNTRQNGQP